MPPTHRKKVLLVGWDAADWKVINPLVDSGKMPNNQRLIENGSMAQLATLHPPLSPMLWTSTAPQAPFQTRHPTVSRNSPRGQGVQPVTNLSRKCKAVWNIFNQNDIRSTVIGWWPSQSCHFAERCHRFRSLSPGERAGSKVKPVRFTRSGPCCPEPYIRPDWPKNSRSCGFIPTIWSQRW